MKAILEFNLPEENAEFKNAVSANCMKSVLYDISQNIFRPARKHGYSDRRMAKFLDSDGCLKQEIADAIGVLEDMYCELLSENNLSIH